MHDVLFDYLKKENYGMDRKSQVNAVGCVKTSTLNYVG
jgi:hypothetical protein